MHIHMFSFCFPGRNELRRDVVYLIFLNYAIGSFNSIYIYRCVIVFVNFSLKQMANEVSLIDTEELFGPIMTCSEYLRNAPFINEIVKDEGKFGFERGE